MVILFYFSPAHQVRRSEKFLRSSGKRWEAKLPTCPLIINENAPNCAEKKLHSWKKGVVIQSGWRTNSQEIYFGAGCLFKCLSEKVLLPSKWRVLSGRLIVTIKVRTFWLINLLTPNPKTGTFFDSLLPFGPLQRNCDHICNTNLFWRVFENRLTFKRFKQLYLI